MEAEAAKFIGAGLAMLALLGVGIGLGNLFSGLYQAASRNPAALNSYKTFVFIGFALTEATGLFALVIAFLILFA
ncbi:MULTISPECIES: F0F1 ATP synthase subunit C [Niveispirillum]|uniref:ATP synthase subunit c n=1 Tax=Niveispirillum cyanobacteriorum TaxID=1612173 RepID=A0A2K9NAD1_9PROT|nr:MULTISPECIES: F0F1 ATP synthase subunit C [Niveispirillum]AUN29962.1 F0F1 ATP synthase subunit C [Niveispirillum cyanobacteriorum]MBJ7416913.1 F0F1 ATP synthase subunit C [Niveispirillum sp.]MBP7336811.1 F0F1 ATP synthase subunit C [Niveispirillum sp.]GGE59117.1 ATP synthase subunit c [Niveispirillum cyanobacteriorum]